MKTKDIRKNLEVDLIKILYFVVVSYIGLLTYIFKNAKSEIEIKLKDLKVQSDSNTDTTNEIKLEISEHKRELDKSQNDLKEALRHEITNTNERLHNIENSLTLLGSNVENIAKIGEKLEYLIEKGNDQEKILTILMSKIDHLENKGKNN